MPDQTNPHGTLFGGVLLTWIDKVAFMSAQLHSGVRHVVTASIDEVQFLAPVQVGDHVILSSGIESVGRSSMEVVVVVTRIKPTTEQRSLAAKARLTFVALDALAQPHVVPELEFNDGVGVLQSQVSRLRVRLRRRLDQFTARRLSSGLAAVAVANNSPSGPF